MNKLLVAASSCTAVSWRDETSPPPTEGEGLKKLREAIELAKASCCEPQSMGSTLESRAPAGKSATAS